MAMSFLKTGPFQDPVHVAAQLRQGKRHEMGSLSSSEKS
jgi:hypothetical protein